MSQDQTTQALGPALLAEFVGTAFLLAAIVGSGIMAERLTTDGAVQLAVHAVVVAVALIVLIAVLMPASGAHLNPAVTLSSAVARTISPGRAAAYGVAQLTGAALGTVATNVMFELPGVAAGTIARDGAHLWLGEFVATLGLVLVIVALVRSGRTERVPVSVGLYIGAAIFFTSSTSFANPAVTVARGLTDSYTGIVPAHSPPFVVAQLLGGLVGLVLARMLYPTSPNRHVLREKSAQTARH